MKVTQQSPVIPSRPTEPTAPVADVEKAATAAPVVQPQAAKQFPHHSDLFGDAPSVMVGAQDDAVAVVSSDPISGAGSKAAEKFFKGMGPTVHVVEKGDTLSKVAREHYPAAYSKESWVSANIAMANGLEDPNLIRVGQELQLPGIYTYTVQSGDTLGKIAAISENSLSDIVALNGIEDPNLIRVGQEIVLEGPYGEAYVALSGRLWDNAESVKHTVEAGDTLTKLARVYFPEFAEDADMIQNFVSQFAWENGIEDPNLISVGQELVVPGQYTYEVQEGDTIWSLNLPLNGGYSNGLRGADGKPLNGELVPGTQLQLRTNLYHH